AKTAASPASAQLCIPGTDQRAGTASRRLGARTYCEKQVRQAAWLLQSDPETTSVAHRRHLLPRAFIRYDASGASSATSGAIRTTIPDPGLMSPSWLLCRPSR